MSTATRCSEHPCTPCMRSQARACTALGCSAFRSSCISKFKSRCTLMRHARHFPGPATGDTDPVPRCPARNGRGYDVAKAARGTLTHVAPVWYQVRGAADGLELHGGHDLDAGWLLALRAPLDEVSLTRVSPYECIRTARSLRSLPSAACSRMLVGQLCELRLGCLAYMHGSHQYAMLACR